MPHKNGVGTVVRHATFRGGGIPDIVDAAVPLLFIAYGAMMLRATHEGAGALPRARLESADLPRTLWRVVAVTLLFSAFADVLIVIDQLTTNWPPTGHRRTLADTGGNWRGWIITIISSVNLTLIGALIMSRDLGDPPVLEIASESHSIELAHAPDEHTLDKADKEQRQKILSGLESLMQTQQLWLDPDFTLTRLSRRLGVPAKQLSAAINAEYGENISRYINRHRIAHACEWLSRGTTVTSAMLDSGFATKSNFNREFRRVMGTSPGVWKQRTQDHISGAAAS